jgi:hypothetical protein
VKQAQYISANVLFVQMPSEAPSLLLALMWASLANVSHSAFWSVAFLLLPEHAQWKQALVKQLPAQPAQLGRDGQAGAQAVKQIATDVQAAVSGNSGLLQSCIDEAIRLRAMGAPWFHDAVDVL